MMKTLFTLCVGIGISTSAWADTPEFLSHDTAARMCAALQTAEACPKCACEPVSQSHPTAGWKDGATRIATATLVRVTGKRGKTHVDAVHVVLGRPGELYFGGRALHLAPESSKGGQTTWKVNGSRQHMDPCSGHCTPVGAVHVFELERRHVDAKADGGLVIDQSLVTCFMATTLQTVACYATTIGEMRVTSKTLPSRWEGWKRTWQIASSTGSGLSLGKVELLAGSAPPRGISPQAGTVGFRALGERADTMKLVAVRGGAKVDVPRVTRIPRATGP